jgi:transposase
MQPVIALVAAGSGVDRAINEMAANSEFTPVVRRLCCLRGVSTLTGFGLAVEIGDWKRFTGRTIGAYLGLVPTESSSGAQRSQGSITKTGNTHARRLLVEAAWHHRKAYRPGLTMQARWDQAPAASRFRRAAVSSTVSNAVSYASCRPGAVKCCPRSQTSCGPVHGCPP